MNLPVIFDHGEKHKTITANMSGVCRTFKYYYDLMSQPSRALWIALRLSKAPYDDCPVPLRNSAQLSSEFKKINRFQKLPAIVDGDFHLAESVAILRYLADTGRLRTTLYPSDPQERARVDEFLEWQHLGVRAACGNYFLRLWLLPMNKLAPMPTDGEEAKLRKEMERSLDVIEKIWLEHADFVSGTQMKIADLFGACEIEQTRLAKYNVEEKYPKIRDWMSRVRERANPYYDEAHKFIYKKSGSAPKI